MESKRDCSSVATSSSGWNPVKNNWRLCTLGKRVADAYLLLQIINICSPHAAKQLLAPCCGNLQVNGLHCTMQVLTCKYWLTSTDFTSTDYKYWLQVLTAPSCSTSQCWSLAGTATHFNIEVNCADSHHHWGNFTTWPIVCDSRPEHRFAFNSENISSHHCLLLSIGSGNFP